MAKSKVNEAGNYTKPAMRKRIFNRIKAGTKPYKICYNIIWYQIVKVK